MNLELAGTEIPVSALSCFDTLSILALVPLFDQFLYPYCKKIGYPLTMLQKIGTYACTVAFLLYSYSLVKKNNTVTLVCVLFVSELPTRMRNR